MDKNKVTNFLKDGTQNIIQSCYDNFIESNAKLRSTAGLKSTITRMMLGECCEWCAAIAGTYEYGKEPKDIYRRHKNCDCVVIFKSEKGYYQDAHTSKKYGTPKEVIADRVKKLQSELENAPKYIDVINVFEYNGNVPKNWVKNVDITDDALKNANPKYDPFRKNEYSDNCPNCVCAYEARKRGYNVTAGPYQKSNTLRVSPEKAWESPNVVHAKGNGFGELQNAMMQEADGVRYQVAYTMQGNDYGHTVVMEKINGELHLFDPQRGKELDLGIFDYFEDDKTKFWRIDNIEFSQQGYTACEVVK